MHGGLCQKPSLSDYEMLYREDVNSTNLIHFCAAYKKDMSLQWIGNITTTINEYICIGPSQEKAR